MTEAGRIPASEEAADGLPLPQRLWAILTITLGISLGVLDNAIVNVALPTIARELGVSPAESVWIIKVYLLTIAVTLLPLSSLGDILGYRKIYLAGLLLFALGSLACSLTRSLETLVAARILQGVGASAIFSVNVALLRFIYPRRHLGRGIGINALVVSLATAIGPTVTAGVLAIANWHWLFALHVPLGALALLAGSSHLPRIRGNGHRFDTPSALLNAAALSLLLLAINGLGQPGAAITVTAQLAAAVAFGYVLIRRQLTMPSPLFPVDLLQIPAFSLSVISTMCAFTIYTLTFIAVPFYLHDVLGRSAVETGLLMTAWPVAVVFMAPIAGSLADRYPAGILCTIGLLIIGSGLVAMALLPEQPGALAILWPLAVCGMGFGLFHSPNNRMIILSAPPARSGGAGGMQGTSRLLGQTVGAAIVALVFTHLAEGTSVALLIGAALSVVAALISSLRLLPIQQEPVPREGNSNAVNKRYRS